MIATRKKRQEGELSDDELENISGGLVMPDGLSVDEKASDACL